MIKYIVLALLLLLVSSISVMEARPAEAAGDGVTKYRALLVWGDNTDPAFKSDLTTLQLVLGNSTNWVGANATIEIFPRLTDPPPTANDLLTKIGTFFAAADDDDFSLLYYAGHGTKRDPDVSTNISNPDEPASDDPTVCTVLGECPPQVTAPLPTTCGGAHRECDEGLGLAGGPLIDDRLGAGVGITASQRSMNRIPGDVLTVLDSCFSGGMGDGSLDINVARSGLLAAAGTNEPSNTLIFRQADGTLVRSYGLFGRYLALALTANGSGTRAQADTSPADGRVTINEWFNFAQAGMTSMAPILRQAQIDGGLPVIPQNPTTSASTGGMGDLTVVNWKNNNLPGAATPLAVPHTDTGARTVSPRCGGEDSVGGEVGLLGNAAPPAESSSGSSPLDNAAPIAGAAAAAGALVVLAAAGWYARRRFRHGRTDGMR